MIVGGLIILFLVVEPHGIAQIWRLAKEKLRLWPFFRTELSKKKLPRGIALRRPKSDKMGEKPMKFKLLAAAVSSIALASPVFADLVLPWMSYRTGPYAVAGIPLADGYADYLTMLNERDGGIGGVPVRLLECETGYNTEKRC